MGISGMDIDAVAAYLAAWSRGETPENPSDEYDNASMIRLACEDLKAFYSEAATAQPGRGGLHAGSTDLLDWFWTETVAGQTLLTMRNALSAHDEQMVKIVGQAIVVPYSHTHLQPR